MKTTTKISMRRKLSLLAILCITTFLIPIGARGAQPPPLVTVVNVSTVTYGSNGCTTSSPLQVISDNFSIPAGHSAYILPPVFTGLFQVQSSTNPFYGVVWYVNSTQLGQMNSYAIPGGPVTEASFGQEIISSTGLSFFNTAHTGPVTYDFIVDITTTSGQSVCVQLPYLSLAMIET